MHRFRQVACGLAAAVTLACVTVTPAAAGGRPFGYVPWGLGHGLFGVVAGVAALPLTIASAALAAVTSAGGYPGAAYPPGYAGGGWAGSAPPPAYYPAPAAYGPPAGYYPHAPVYYAPARPYYAPPRTYYAPPQAYSAAR